ncbi:DUF1194 domain-containing protein [Nostoc sphaeroides]|jgi:hypothetical protein|uniref:VWFA domain-containing protein n=1 Tax=Nostoc sphaeroides CCNUC1 TaxID=2653204 RepID=A0A5P8W4T6_9NOSO|nr:DUF1194 domain-containing protein [Nostoc sphaeroides]MCC5631144.1 DUF1194 domain-containing protein [Nostoc sphaeroides CHAB 2801]QFS47286.1 hypothetical protein GXM_04776 [Nostoc sphaeroides CCNUC1]
MKISNFVRATLTAASCCLSILAISTSAHAATLVPVDLELSLLVDVSGSVDNSEFNLQKQGYVNAFSNANLFNDFISKGNLGKIAVNLIYWSSANQQQEVVGWSLIDSVAAAQTFANNIAATTRVFSGSTAIGSALNFAAPKFFNNDYDGARQVIDVSGDGATNDGANTIAARNAALALGVDAINGVTIGSEAGLQAFYQNNVIGGTNANGDPAFVLAAQNFQDFGAAIDKKIKAEIKPTSVPEPASIVGLLVFGTIGASSMLKRNKKFQADC